MNTRERKTDKVLRLGIVQGGTIIEERLVSGKDSISVGQSPKNEVLIPSPQVPNRHRLIEVKGLSEPSGTIILTPNERRVAEDRRDCYWLYIVTNCGTQPALQEPIKDPARFPWHEVMKVQHYWLDVNVITRPMVARKDTPQYGGEE